MLDQDQEKLARRLLARLKVEGECWRWIGSTDREGVGRLKVGGCHGRPLPVPRLAYELLVALVPAGKELGRIEACPNKWCWNPAHREPMTRTEIHLRHGTPSGINAVRTHCRRGHEFTAENTRFVARGSGVTRICKTCRREQRRAKREDVACA